MSDTKDQNPQTEKPIKPEDKPNTEIKHPDMTENKLSKGEKNTLKK